MKEVAFYILAGLFGYGLGWIHCRYRQARDLGCDRKSAFVCALTGRDPPPPQPIAGGPPAPP